MTIERINALIQASHVWAVKSQKSNYGHGFCWVGIDAITETHISIVCMHYEDTYSVDVLISDLDKIILDKVTV